MTNHTKEKGRTGGGRATQKTNHGADYSNPDPFAGGYSLAENVKPSRNREQKRSWKRGPK